MKKDTSSAKAVPSFEPPAIRVLARFEQITLGSPTGKNADAPFANKH